MVPSNIKTHLSILNTLKLQVTITGKIMKRKHNYAVIFYKFTGVCRNVDGNNPVHLAAINGYTNTMVAILSIHSHLVNAENRAGVRIISSVSIYTRRTD